MNLENLEKINAAKGKSILIAVTKKRSVDEILPLIHEGVTHIGENRLIEGEEKIPKLPSSVTKHFIGHLQGNKVKGVVKWFDVIHSVDRLKLAKKINEEAHIQQKVMPILIQVNTSMEEQKGGVDPKELLPLIVEIQSLKNIKIIGLMTMAMLSKNEEKIRSCFRKLKSLLDDIRASEKIDSSDIKELSMGMSNDYEIALEEGATMIRIGRKLFE